MSRPPRHALYWAPEASHPLWQRGCEWLGRDPTNGATSAPRHAATIEPGRYGFHATLKAPTALRPGASEAGFLAAVEAFARGEAPFEMPTLQVGTLDRFVALLPREPLARPHPLHRIADACVRGFDAWRAPLDAAALAQRMAKSPLSAPQLESLQRWGYPHVLAHWRFHMTLSDSIADAIGLQAARDEAQRFFADALSLPLRFESLCVFRESAPGAPFELLRRLPLEGRLGR